MTAEPALFQGLLKSRHSEIDRIPATLKNNKIKEQKQEREVRIRRLQQYERDPKPHVEYLMIQIIDSQTPGQFRMIMESL